MKSALARWLSRYLPAEAAGLLASIVSANAVWLTADANAALVAVIAAWAETLAYYSVVLLRDLHANRGKLHRTLRNLVLEFGLAEALDSLLIRPAAIYLATQLVADLTLAVILGKLAADVVFYVPTIAAFELRRRYLPA